MCILVLHVLGCGLIVLPTNKHSHTSNFSESDLLLRGYLLDKAIHIDNSMPGWRKNEPTSEFYKAEND